MDALPALADASAPAAFVIAAGSTLFLRWVARGSAAPGPARVELHVHLDGSFDNRLLYEEARKNPSTLDARHQEAMRNVGSYEEFERMVTCKGKRSLTAMLGNFDIFIPIVRGNYELLEELAYRFVRSQARQNIIYTEVRYSPQLLCEGGAYEVEGGTDAVDGKPAVEAVTRGLRRGEQEFGVIVNQILCCLSFRPDWAMATVELADEFRSSFPCAVVGIDIAAGEAHFVAEDSNELYTAHKRAFAYARGRGLNITMHAGEVGDGGNVLAAADTFGATRVGHGYRIASSPDLLAKAIEKGIHFEICPTSSFETGGWTGEGADVAAWHLHPFRTLLRAGADCGLNSDDPSVFLTDLAREYRICEEAMGIAAEHLAALSLNAIDAAFCTPAQRKWVRQRLAG